MAGDSDTLDGFNSTDFAFAQWGYNQTTATYNLYNSIWSSTFNSTYDAKISFNNTNLAYTNQTNTHTANITLNGTTAINYNNLTTGYTHWNGTCLITKSLTTRLELC
jgi:hypothetical protein